MQIMRIVVTGTVGAGKSTFVRTVSEIEPVETDQAATDETATMKTHTTVAMDFGRLHFGTQTSLHVYGTPGQERFDFMWDILIRKAHAFILLVSSHRPQDLRGARKILSFMRYRAKIPFLIGLTHTDLPNAWSMEDISVALGFTDSHSRPPICRVDPRDRVSAVQTLVELIQEYTRQKRAVRVGSPNCVQTVQRS
ncbi:MAG: ATP/GTP-binding protein [Pseudanabaenaceae cyanobacterium SKYGB_i_bin29]|nr:ATP/GTP-binding protein [Pseudanabaenaceae cyanobacterium SKYG29]MDW8421676.1 ATP/GTP-binding protein [Pseudanabaenaceae cyanobacterium SKYGB_i_bin29]